MRSEPKARAGRILGWSLAWVAVGCGGVIEEAATGEPEVSASQALTGRAPVRVFLWFADGKHAPVEGPPCVGRIPAAYRCSFASSPEACKREVVKILNRWYADFNVELTTERPAGGADYNVVITSRGDWCGQRESVAGLAPIDCEPLVGATSYAFQCGRDAQTCAMTIAQEHAHAVGLEHTASKTDIMHPQVGHQARGFDNRDSAVKDGVCRRTQNSYALMRARLGSRNPQ